ncbi:tryptophan-tRNA synthetase, putative [Theileria annulata]|uniref:tryptophan--tRNA ligase n=1 Tax=Theileria annulata TaxID=5874 RepID=Q4U8R8_THEAN|nr:tryptophan-tRNA synthetase, putative [Theileria annulata]CAI76785.1 tryptophan-tRNA synthetase, putative [Theileria annulata]|eukprot:XP_953410.1 tryptophan-tRNA synthetase, putative [Theileria annulata]
MHIKKIIYLLTLSFKLPFIYGLISPNKLLKGNVSFINSSKTYIFPGKHKPTHNNVTLSGIQPTGEIHIGNYIGCISPCLKYQKLHSDLNVMIADNHAISGLKSNDNLKKYIRSTIALSIASGINPEKTRIFVQSQFPQILELNWLLGSVVRTGKFYKIAQFRNRQIKVSKENLATFLYPLLMSSDIFALNASSIIAGPDQRIHLTLARYVARKLNRYLDTNYFIVPQMVKGFTYKVKSLSNGRKKMSKSSELKYDTINMLDTDDDIYRKIKNAKTQSSEDVMTPETSNLLHLYSFFSNKPYPELVKNTDLSKLFDLKMNLADSIIDFLKPIKMFVLDISFKFRKYYEIIGDDKLFDQILSKSNEYLSPKLNRRIKVSPISTTFSRKLKVFSTSKLLMYYLIII